MIVVGGSYIEICTIPSWHRIFGSGGRAAAALSLVSPATELHTYAGKTVARDVERSMEAFGVIAHVTEIEEEISFSYFHPLSVARISPERPLVHAPLVASGSALLRFGLVEGDAVVIGGRVTYDPQGADRFVPFAANGSRANELAIVLNEAEARRATGADGPDAARSLLAAEGAAVVVIKGGAKGALVAEVGRDIVAVPAYRSDVVFKIGSGDVFSAVFAHAWGERRMDAASAAIAASAETSRYAASTALPLQTLDPPDEALAIPAWHQPGRVYLAGPFFDSAQLWLIEELRELLIDAGAEVFSPFHDVGMELPPSEIARFDLDGLRASDAMLAVFDGEDPGTVFEVGYAAALSKRVVVLAERTPPANLTMLAVPGVEVVRDLTTAVYKAIWASVV